MAASFTGDASSSRDDESRRVEAASLASDILVDITGIEKDPLDEEAKLAWRTGLPASDDSGEIFFEGEETAAPSSTGTFRETEHLKKKSEATKQLDEAAAAPAEAIARDSGGRAPLTTATSTTSENVSASRALTAGGKDGASQQGDEEIVGTIARDFTSPCDLPAPTADGMYSRGRVEDGVKTVKVDETLAAADWTPRLTKTSSPRHAEPSRKTYQANLEAAQRAARPTDATATRPAFASRSDDGSGIRPTGSAGGQGGRPGETTGRRQYPASETGDANEEARRTGGGWDARPAGNDDGRRGRPTDDADEEARRRTGGGRDARPAGDDGGRRGRPTDDAYDLASRATEIARREAQAAMDRFDYATAPPAQTWTRGTYGLRPETSDDVSTWPTGMADYARGVEVRREAPRDRRAQDERGRSGTGRGQMAWESESYEDDRLDVGRAVLKHHEDDRRREEAAEDRRAWKRESDERQREFEGRQADLVMELQRTRRQADQAAEASARQLAEMQRFAQQVDDESRRNGMAARQAEERARQAEDALRAEQETCARQVDEALTAERASLLRHTPARAPEAAPRTVRREVPAERPAIRDRPSEPADRPAMDGDGHSAENPRDDRRANAAAAGGHGGDDDGDDDRASRHSSRRSAGGRGDLPDDGGRDRRPVRAGAGGNGGGGGGSDDGHSHASGKSDGSRGRRPPDPLEDDPVEDLDAPIRRTMIKTGPVHFGGALVTAASYVAPKPPRYELTTIKLGGGATAEPMLNRFYKSTPTMDSTDDRTGYASSPIFSDPRLASRELKSSIAMWDTSGGRPVFEFLADIQQESVDKLIPYEMWARHAFGRLTAAGKEEWWRLLQDVDNPCNMADWVDFVQRFGERFGARSIARALDKLLEVRQNPGEGIRQYYERLRAASNGLPQRMSQDDVDTFFRGMRDHELRRLVLQEAPQTLETAFQIALAKEWAVTVGARYDSAKKGGSMGSEAKTQEAFRDPKKKADKDDAEVMFGVSMPQPPRKQEGKPEVKCFNCGKTGHYSKDCYAKAKTAGDDEKKQKAREDGLCYECNKPGHVARDCTAKTCRNCGKLGHIAKDCRSAPKAAGATAGGGSSSKNVVLRWLEAGPAEDEERRGRGRAVIAFAERVPSAKKPKAEAPTADGPAINRNVDAASAAAVDARSHAEEVTRRWMDCFNGKEDEEAPGEGVYQATVLMERTGAQSTRRTRGHSVSPSPETSIPVTSKAPTLPSIPGTPVAASSEGGVAASAAEAGAATNLPTVRKPPPPATATTPVALARKPTTPTASGKATSQPKEDPVLAREKEAATTRALLEGADPEKWSGIDRYSQGDLVADLGRLQIVPAWPPETSVTRAVGTFSDAFETLQQIDRGGDQSKVTDPHRRRSAIPPEEQSEDLKRWMAAAKTTVAEVIATSLTSTRGHLSPEDLRKFRARMLARPPPWPLPGPKKRTKDLSLAASQQVEWVYHWWEAALGDPWMTLVDRNTSNARHTVSAAQTRYLAKETPGLWHEEHDADVTATDMAKLEAKLRAATAGTASRPVAAKKTPKRSKYSDGEDGTSDDDDDEAGAADEEAPPRKKGKTEAHGDEARAAKGTKATSVEKRTRGKTEDEDSDGGNAGAKVTAASPAKRRRVVKSAETVVDEPTDDEEVKGDQGGRKVMVVESSDDESRGYDPPVHTPEATPPPTVTVGRREVQDLRAVNAAAPQVPRGADNALAAQLAAATDGPPGQPQQVANLHRGYFQAGLDAQAAAAAAPAPPVAAGVRKLECWSAGQPAHFALFVETDLGLHERLDEVQHELEAVWRRGGRRGVDPANAAQGGDDAMAYDDDTQIWLRRADELLEERRKAQSEGWPQHDPRLFTLVRNALALTRPEWPRRRRTPTLLQWQQRTRQMPADYRVMEVMLLKYGEVRGAAGELRDDEGRVITAVRDYHPQLEGLVEEHRLVQQYGEYALFQERGREADCGMRPEFLTWCGEARAVQARATGERTVRRRTGVEPQGWTAADEAATLYTRMPWPYRHQYVEELEIPDHERHFIYERLDEVATLAGLVPSPEYVVRGQWTERDDFRTDEVWATHWGKKEVRPRADRNRQMKFPEKSLKAWQHARPAAVDQREREEEERQRRRDEEADDLRRQREADDERRRRIAVQPAAVTAAAMANAGIVPAARVPAVDPAVLAARARNELSPRGNIILMESSSEGGSTSESEAAPRSTSVPCETTILGHPFLALADSGASDTVVSKQVAKDLGIDAATTAARIQGFGGFEKGLRTRDQIPIQVAGTTTKAHLLIADIPGHYGVILGMDVMRKIGAVIDTAAQKLILRSDLKALRAMVDAAEAATGQTRTERPDDAYVRLLAVEEDKRERAPSDPPGEPSRRVEIGAATTRMRVEVAGKGDDRRPATSKQDGEAKTRAAGRPSSDESRPPGAKRSEPGDRTPTTGPPTTSAGSSSSTKKSGETTSASPERKKPSEYTTAGQKTSEPRTVVSKLLPTNLDERPKKATDESFGSCAASGLSADEKAARLARVQHAIFVLESKKAEEDWDERLRETLSDLNAARPPDTPEWSTDWTHTGTAINQGGDDAESKDMVNEATYEVGTSTPEQRRAAIMARFEAQRLAEWDDASIRKMIAAFQDKTEICPLHVSELKMANLPKMRINVKSQVPIRRTYGQRHDDHEKELAAMVDEMERAGVVERRPSAWCFPLLLVWQNGKARLCHDLRGLNAVVEMDNAEMPLILQSQRRAAAGRWFTKLDMRKGYWQIGLEEDSQQYAAFTLKGQSYVFTRVPFGVATAPQWYCKLMAATFEGMEGVHPYFDDIVIATDGDLAMHAEQVCAVVERLAAYGIQVNLEKCLFAQREIEFLGKIVANGEIRVDQSKIEPIVNRPPPTNRKELMEVFGMINYYKEHIHHCAWKAQPMTNLLRKDVPWDWTPLCEERYRGLMADLVSPAVLAAPTFSAPFILQTDASDVALGAVLSQVDENGVERPISFAARRLTGAEEKYSATEKEALGAIYGIRQFSMFLQPRKFLLFTDHSALQWMFRLDGKSTNQRVMRWIMLMQDFCFDVLYRKGRDNANADFLSRPPGKGLDACEAKVNLALAVEGLTLEGGGDGPSTKESTDDPTNEQAMAREAKMTATCFLATVVETRALIVTRAQRKAEERREAGDEGEAGDAVEFDARSRWPTDDEDDRPAAAPSDRPAGKRKSRRQVRKERKRQATREQEAETVDPWEGDWIVALLRDEVEPKGGTGRTWKVEAGRYRWDDGQLWYVGAGGEFKLRVPPKAYRRELCLLAHNEAHATAEKTSDYIRRQQGLWWPKMQRTVDAVVAGCDICARNRRAPMMAHPAQSLRISEPFDRVAIDLVKMPTSVDGYSYVLTIVDFFTRWAHAEPLFDKAARSVAQKLLGFFADFGTSRVLVSDNGKEFVAAVVKELNELAGVKTRNTHAYSPWQNGHNERFNGTIVRLIQRLPEEFKGRWSQYVPLVLAAYRSCVHSSTGETPNMMVFGRESRWFGGAWTVEKVTGEPEEVTWREALINRAKQLEALRECVYPRVRERVERKSMSDRDLMNRRNKIVPQPLRVGQLVYRWDERKVPKSGATYLGPFRIIGQLPGGSYRLANDNGDILPNSYPLQKLKLGKELAPAESIFEVEQIVDHEVGPTGRRFLVQWKGYTTAKNTWVAEEDFTDDGMSVEEYFKSPPAPKDRRERRPTADGIAAAAP